MIRCSQPRPQGPDLIRERPIRLFDIAEAEPVVHTGVGVTLGAVVGAVNGCHQPRQHFLLPSAPPPVQDGDSCFRLARGAVEGSDRCCRLLVSLDSVNHGGQGSVAQ